MTNQTATHNVPLQTAPEATGPSPEAKPNYYSARFLVETEEGFHVEIGGEQLPGRDLMTWMQRFSKALQDAGFKPVRRDVLVDIDVPAATGGANAAAPSDTSGEAIKLPPATEGAPPRCSLHGPMKWLEGTSKTGPNTGKPYAFWACNIRDCKPRDPNK